MVRIGNTHVGSSVGGDVRYNVAVYNLVVGIQLHRNLYVGIYLFEILDKLLIDLGLLNVFLVLCPEYDLVLPRGIKFLRHLKGIVPLGAVA